MGSFYGCSKKNRNMNLMKFAYIWHYLAFSLGIHSWFPGEIPIQPTSLCKPPRCGCLPQWCNVWSCVWKMPFWRVALHHLMSLGTTKWHTLKGGCTVSNRLNGSQPGNAGDYCDDNYWWKYSLIPFLFSNHFSNWAPIRNWRCHWPHWDLTRGFSWRSILVTFSTHT